MEIEKISDVCIKPSSPTPPHLKSYKISLLDQISAPSAIPIILYYFNQDISLTSKMSILLKQSLSEALTHYYPLAGRIKDNLFVDCNDEGACYVKAKANISLSEYLTLPDLQSLNSLLPINNWHVPFVIRPNVLIIQETIFACGSIAVGVLGSHMVVDGIALVSFLKCWAAIACNSTKNIIPPNFDGPFIFPQNEAFPEDIVLSIYKPLIRIGKSSFRRFVFDASNIAKLKAETTSSVENPTRVELVSALLLKCITTVLKERSSGIDKPLGFSHTVNFRRRAKPQLPESSLGNFWNLSPALCSPNEIKIPELLCKQREAIRKIDTEFVMNLQSEGFNKLHELFKEVFNPTESSETGMNFVGITSWCNFGCYEVDFGWGKPMWVSSAALPSSNDETPFINILQLLDGATHKGIEACVTMEEDELVLLEKHKHLLQYASLNPSPFSLDK